MPADRSETPQPFAIVDFVGDELEPVRPIKKGDRPGPASGRPAPVAKTGYCGFSTIRRVTSRFMDDHVQYLLDEVEENLRRLQDIVRDQALTWSMTCFYEPTCDDLPPDAVSRRNLARAEEYGIMISNTHD